MLDLTKLDEKNDGEKRRLLWVKLHVVFKALADGERRFNPSRLCGLLDEDIGVYKVVLTGGNSDDGNNSNASLGSQVVHCNYPFTPFLRTSAKITWF